MVYYGLTGFFTWQHSFGGQAWQLAFVWFFPILECHEFSLKKFGRRNLAAAQHPGDLVIVTGRGIHSREGLTKKHQPNECLAALPGFFVSEEIFPVEKNPGVDFPRCDVNVRFFLKKIFRESMMCQIFGTPEIRFQGRKSLPKRRCLH